MPADIYKENGELIFGVFSSMNACLGLMCDGTCVYICILKKNIIPKGIFESH